MYCWCPWGVLEVPSGLVVGRSVHGTAPLFFRWSTAQIHGWAVLGRRGPGNVAPETLPVFLVLPRSDCGSCFTPRSGSQEPSGFVAKQRATKRASYNAACIRSIWAKFGNSGLNLSIPWNYCPWLRTKNSQCNPMCLLRDVGGCCSS